MQIVEVKREAKSKAEKERRTQLNAEFQSVARKEKKAFLSEQCKETEENNRMGKTRNLFKKIGDTLEIFHAKIGTIRQKWQGPNRSRRDLEKVARIHRTEIGRAHV